MDEEALEEMRMEEADKRFREERKAAELARKRREEEDNEAIRQSSEFQELVAYVLEGTLFNLVTEVSAGEFALDTVPRQIVRSLEIEEQPPEPVE